MSSFQRMAIATIAAILGAQIPGLITAPTLARSSGNCAYEWGDLNRAAERAGIAVYRDLNGYGEAYRSAELNNTAVSSEATNAASNASYGSDGSYAANAEYWGSN